MSFGLWDFSRVVADEIRDLIALQGRDELGFAAR
jgi:hypothetical protein